MGRSRRFLTVISLLSLIAAAGASAATTTITFWHPWGGATGKEFSNLVQRFNNEHRSIKVVAQTVDVTEIDQKVLIAIASGKGPDIAWGFPSLLGRSGDFIADLSPFIQTDKAGLSDVLPRYWEAARYKGKILGFPIEANGTAVAYNVDLLANSGITAPPQGWNWDTFADTAKRLTLDKNGDGKPDQWGWSTYVDLGDPWAFLPFLWQAKGELFDDDNAPKKCRVNSKEAVEALKYLVNLGNKLGVTAPNLNPGALTSKKVAMETAGAYSLNDWAKVKNFRINSALLPKYRDEANILLIGHLYIVKKKDAAQKAAWDFIKWFCSPEINAQWAVKTGYLPIRKKAMNSQSYLEQVKRVPATGAFINGMDSARPRPFWLPAWRRMGQALGKQINRALLQQTSPEQALESANDELTKILASTKTK